MTLVGFAEDFGCSGINELGGFVGGTGADDTESFVIRE